MDTHQQARRERIPVYLAPKTKALLARIAAADGESMTGTVRNLLRAEAERRGLRPAETEGPAR